MKEQTRRSVAAIVRATEKGDAMSIIDDLRAAKGLYTFCPSCNEEFRLRDANLFYATKSLPERAIQYVAEQRNGLKDARAELKGRVKELKRRSYTSAETSGFGQIVEMLSPSVPGFPLKPSDCRALMKPIDYVGFKGLSLEGRVDAVVFVEVKTGTQRLSKEQTQIKRCVETGKVKLIISDHSINLQ